MTLIDVLGLKAKKVSYTYSFPDGGPVPPSMYWYTNKGPK